MSLVLYLVCRQFQLSSRLLESKDVINTFEEVDNSGLVIWVDHQYKNNEKLIQKLATSAPHLAVLGCESTESLRNLYLQNRSTKMGCLGRFRIITNRFYF